MLHYDSFGTARFALRDGAADIAPETLAEAPLRMKFRGDRALEQRIHALEQGEDSSEKDRQVWEAVFARQHVCEREDEEHAHEHEHDHDHDHEMSE